MITMLMNEMELNRDRQKNTNSFTLFFKSDLDGVSRMDEVAYGFVQCRCHSPGVDRCSVWMRNSPILPTIYYFICFLNK